jgi:alkane 1-monooxygenase
MGVPICAIFTALIVAWTKLPQLWWIGPLLIFGVIPVLDVALGEDGNNPPDEVIGTLSANRYYRWCTYLYLPQQFGALIIAALLWSRGGLDLVDKVGLAVTIGVFSGIGINAAHELGHRSERAEQVLSKIALAPSCYGHFFVEHNRGHHSRVATPEDPASSRYGESLWRFLPRTVSGSLRSAVELERKRLASDGKRFFDPRNHVLQAWAISLVLHGSLIALWGLRIAPYLAIQAAIAILLLESVNYVEHYGLLRQRRASGRYERVEPRHSWNSDRLVTNLLLFHLQRHSDHHANPHRRYQTLRTMDEAPQLPAGYATMVLLTFFPPLWRRVMDHRVAAHYAGDLGKANLAPRLR